MTEVIQKQFLQFSKRCKDMVRFRYRQMDLYEAYRKATGLDDFNAKRIIR